MASNDKVKRYEAHILGRLEVGFERLKETGEFDTLNALFDHQLTLNELLNGNITHTKIYRDVARMDDKSGTLIKRFLTELPQKVDQLLQTYNSEHRRESVSLELDLDGFKISTVYSTHASRNLSNHLKDELEARTIKFSEWYSQLFSSIANNTGHFYGVSQEDMLVFAGTKGIDTKQAVRDINFYLTMKKENFDGAQIVSPTAVNLLIYTNPDKLMLK